MGKSRYSNTNVNNEILRNSPEDGAVSSSFSATTISATTFFGGGSGLNDISLSGVTNLQTELDTKLETSVFNSYTGSVVDVFVSSGNANSVTQQLSFTNTTGGTFNVTNSAALFSDNDINVTGGTYNPSNGCVTFTTNSGTTFDVCGFITGLTDTFVTGGTLSGVDLILERSNGIDVSGIDLSSLISGKLDITTFNTYTGDTQTILNSKTDNTDFTSHTGDTTIHYTKDSINLSDLGSSAHTHTISEVIDLQTELDSKIDSDVTNSGEIALIQSTGVVESSNDITYTLTGSSNSKPTIGIGLGGAANTKGGLEINSFVDFNGQPFDYFIYTGVGGQFQNFAGVGLFAISVHTVGRVMSSGIHIFSDERIKKDIEISNSKEDLETISKIEICDYKYIDIVKGGTEKKVIAQQVKKHYPLAVNKGTDVIPCFMQQGELKNGIINLELDCVVGDKIKLIFPNGEEEITAVIEVSDKIIKVDSTKNDKVFVYGKEVNDYQTVDYDALSMLNISATQELYKIIKDLKAEIEELKKNL